MAVTRISRTSLPDHIGAGRPIMLYSNTGTFIGRLVIEGKTGQATSRLELALDQPPYRAMPLKRKHRQR